MIRDILKLSMKFILLYKNFLLNKFYYFSCNFTHLKLHVIKVQAKKIELFLPTHQHVVPVVGPSVSS